MAVLIRPKTWGLQKPAPGAAVNWGHPLAAGLSFANTTAAATGKTGGVDLVTGIAGRPTSIASTVVAARNGFTGIRFAGGSGQQIVFTGTGSRHPLTTVPFTAAAFIDGWGSDLTAVGATNNGPSGWTFRPNNGLGNMRLTKGSVVDIDSTVPTPSGPALVAVVVTATAVTFYANGRVGVVSDSSAMQTGAYDLCVGGRQDGSDTGTGTLAAVYVWKRALAVSDLQRLQAEPFSLLAGPAPAGRLWVAAPAAAGGLARPAVIAPSGAAIRSASW